MPRPAVSWDAELSTLIETRWKAGQAFILADVYEFEPHFAKLYPRNRHRRDKIRQTLQHLRDNGLVEFLDDHGHYRRSK